MMTYLTLAFEFFKTGLFAIGGGLATLPYLMEMAQKYPSWFTLDELMNMIAVSESTPGPIGINMGSYVGFEVGNGLNGIAGGILGSLIATLSLVLPSFLVILIVVRILDRFKSNRRIQGGLQGLHPAVTGLIAAAGFSVLEASLFSTVNGAVQVLWIPCVMFVLFFAALQWKPLKSLHPILFIAVGAVLGVVLGL